MQNGHPVASRAVWETQRKPEILKLFENNVYGEMPKDFDKLSYEITHDVTDAMSGRAHLKEITITVSKGENFVNINLILFTPANVKRAPVFLLINNRGKDNTDPTRETKSGFWPAEMLIDSGYAVAAFHVGDAAPDNADTYQDGVLRLYPELQRKASGMKAIGSWAWAASRVLDYFKMDADVDSSRVNLVGHSRGGKAALWAGAQDERFAMIVSNCSGNTGAAPARRTVGESVKDINTQFPHWFCDNYKRFNDDLTALPVDQHMLIALIAPRPVYTTSATEDIWADPAGSYLSIFEAQPVYAFYNKKSSLTPKPPAANTPIVNSILGYHNREGIHNLTEYDWSCFIRFASYHAGAKKSSNR
jgi:dienelactone hydrolase